MAVLALLNTFLPVPIDFFEHEQLNFRILHNCQWSNITQCRCAQPNGHPEILQFVGTHKNSSVHRMRCSVASLYLRKEWAVNSTLQTHRSNKTNRLVWHNPVNIEISLSQAVEAWNMVYYHGYILCVSKWCPSHPWRNVAINFEKGGCGGSSERY